MKFLCQELLNQRRIQSNCIRRPIWRLIKSGRLVNTSVRRQASDVVISNRFFPFSLQKFVEKLLKKLIEIMQALWYSSYANCKVNVNALLCILFAVKTAGDVWNRKHNMVVLHRYYFVWRIKNYSPALGRSYISRKWP